MNIYQKLLEVRKVVPYLQKESQGHQYQYVGSSQVLAAVRQKLDELGLLLVTQVKGHNVRAETVENKDKYGNLKKTTTYFTELEIEYTWINTEKPDEKIVIPFYGQGVDTAGEKGVGKALTYAEKYFLLKQFNIATDRDDPDSFQERSETYRAPEPITSEQVGLIKTKALEFAEMRGGTVDDVYKHLKIKSITQLTAKQATDMIKKLDDWIDKAKEKQGE
ncbi:ERF family protein [Siminovitchia fortis]|uniref:Single-stranded DNA-binding protein n=1 Tax=Siminovitchia fortis TaxID=254758 RepID=A0A443IN07_9BACI|nr:ERF family protein [Siminovitchia fortis]RWR06716.1 single-stranded DNA-binding protein [Siminovitchia fortis]WHY82980.1 ERF family protein [Siminovitchia fortis]